MFMYDHSPNHGYEQYLLQCRSNLIPISAFQVAQLRASVQSTHAALEACQTDDRNHACDELAKTLECQDSLLAPIRKLPPEILSHIFMFTVTSIYFTQPKLQGLVFRLTWTCSWWRTHVLSRSALWSSFTLDWSSSTFHSYPAEQRAFVKECILRSGNYTHLNVTLKRVKNIRSWSYLLSQTKRFETVHFELYDSSDLEVLQTELNRLFKRLHKKTTEGNSKTFFPCLEKLSLVLPGAFDMYNLAKDVPMNNLFVECPSLHTLRINLLRQTDSIDLSHLTDLRVESYYLGRSFSVLLSKCPKLQTFSVDRFRVEGEDSLHPSSSSSPYVPTLLHHTSLTTLKITWLDRHCIPGFWTGVRLPNLTRLSVTAKGYQITDGVVPALLGELKEMVVKSQCMLKKLSLPDAAVELFMEGNSLTSDVIGNGTLRAAGTF